MTAPGSMPVPHVLRKKRDYAFYSNELYYYEYKKQRQDASGS